MRAAAASGRQMRGRCLLCLFGEKKKKRFMMLSRTGMVLLCIREGIAQQEYRGTTAELGMHTLACNKSYRKRVDARNGLSITRDKEERLVSSLFGRRMQFSECGWYVGWYTPSHHFGR